MQSIVIASSVSSSLKERLGDTVVSYYYGKFKNFNTSTTSAMCDSFQVLLRDMMSWPVDLWTLTYVQLCVGV